MSNVGGLAPGTAYTFRITPLTSVGDGVAPFLLVSAQTRMPAVSNLRFTATQFALLSAAASVVGRLVTGTTAGALIESLGYVQFYLLTTVVALPGVFLYLFMLRAGLVERSLGDAGYRGNAG